MKHIKEKAERDNDLYRDTNTNQSKRITFSLDVPPSINHMYHNTRGGGKRLTSKAERYVKNSRALINEARHDQRWDMPKKYVWLYVDLVFYFPDRRVRDASNCLKILLDVMQGYIFENDYIAMPRIQSVEYDKENPRVDVVVSTQTSKNREHASYLVE